MVKLVQALLELSLTYTVSLLTKYCAFCLQHFHREHQSKSLKVLVLFALVTLLPAANPRDSNGQRELIMMNIIVSINFVISIVVIIVIRQLWSLLSKNLKT